MKLSLVLAALFAVFGLSSSGSALKCYQWSEDDDPTQAKATTCWPGSSANHTCVLIGLEGFNRITRQKVTLSLGICDNNACNTTLICNMAYASIKNFDATKCNARCCDSDMCNAIPASTTPTEVMQTIALPKIARSTKRIYRTIGVPMPTDDTEDTVTIATGLSCYKCIEGTEDDICQLLLSEAQCKPEHNSCVSITGSLSNNANTPHVAYRGCGLAEINCNITQLCLDFRNKLFVREGKEMTGCKGYCCKGRFCNNFNPTRPVKLTTASKATKVRRATTLRSESPPITCHECKPEVFGSMCTKNTTKRVCTTGNHGYDSCLTMTASITNGTTNELIDVGEWKDCAVRDMDCNANSSRCDSLAHILKIKGLGLKNCLVNCCQGDLCNDFAPTSGPNITVLARSNGQGRLLAMDTMIMNGMLLLIFLSRNLHS